MDFSLKWHEYRLNLAARTHLMGVLNVTPDSFSDGGKFFSETEAVLHGIQMAKDGAHIIDVGGESTRPYSERLPVEDELARVIPVIRRLSRETSVPISVDTYKSRVAREALKAGAAMINDISALRFDPEMANVVKEAGVPVILMHMQGTPLNMQLRPTYTHLLQEITDFFRDALARAESAGIDENRIILDPGIGFGKTFGHNLRVIHHLERFRALERPLLAGPSNKAFIGKILDREAHERDTGTMAAVAACVMNGAHIIRVHNVKMAAETIKVIDAIKRERVSEALLP